MYVYNRENKLDSEIWPGRYGSSNAQDQNRRVFEAASGEREREREREGARPQLFDLRLLQYRHRGKELKGEGGRNGAV